MQALACFDPMKVTTKLGDLSLAQLLIGRAFLPFRCQFLPFGYFFIVKVEKKHTINVFGIYSTN